MLFFGGGGGERESEGGLRICHLLHLGLSMLRRTQFCLTGYLSLPDVNVSQVLSDLLNYAR